MKFSQRMGLVKVRTALQTSDMTAELRSTLWNALYDYMGSVHNFLRAPYGFRANIAFLGEAIWRDHLKRPIDDSPGEDGTARWLKKAFLESKWYEVYDLLEMLVAYFEDDRLDGSLNAALEAELAGYRLVARTIAQITREEEIAAVEDALSEDRAPGAQKHLAAALSFLADRKSPNFRNSIKESISAVESVARFSTGNEKATLEQALKRLEGDGHMHPALKSAFTKLYGYTSDERGIRHAMLDEPNVTIADAKFFLIACSAFVSYVVSTLPASG